MTAKIRLGRKEKYMLTRLIMEGVNTQQGMLIWKYIQTSGCAKRYEKVLFKRIMRLAEKGLLNIKPDGKRGGQMIYFTQNGLKLAKQLYDEYAAANIY